MNNKTARFLLLEAVLIAFVLLLSQIFPYPISGKDQVAERMEALKAHYDYRLITRVELGSSLLYLLEVDGQYCEKLFDKSMLFDRYIEKPLVLLRKTGEGQELEFVARDSARSHLYSINESEQLVLKKQTNNEWFTLAYVLGGGTLILLGMVFGTGRRRPAKA